MGFFGVDRLAMVDSLLHLRNRAVDHGKPHLVVLSAPSGWGKTTVIQQLYRRLARAQFDPPYWPAEITTGRENSPDPRKVVAPGAFQSAGHFEWLWLGLEVKAHPGLTAPSLAHLEGQLHAHLKPILTRLSSRASGRDAASEAVKAVAFTFLPDIFAWVDAGTAVSGHIAEAIRRHRDATQDVRLVDPNEERRAAADGLTAFFTNVLGRRAANLPVVVAIDDAHRLDAEEVRLVQGILASDAPVLLVATAWPDILAQQASDSSTFGGWLALHGQSDTVRVWDLEPLATLDLMSVVLERAPDTDRRITQLLADRADGNPLVLLGLLDNPIVRRSTRNHSLALSERDVDALPTDLTGVIVERWGRLSDEAASLLAGAALQGEVFLLDVVIRSLEDLFDDTAVDQTVRDGWLRTQHSTVMVEFVERLLYEVARDRVNVVLGPDERDAVARRLLVAVKEQLGRPTDLAVRDVMQAIHFRLALEGYEEDLAAAAMSADLLGEKASGDHSRVLAIERFLQAAEWWEAPTVDDPVHAVRSQATATRLLRIHGDSSRSRSIGMACVQMAEQRLGRTHALTVRAWRELSMTLRRTEPPEPGRARELWIACDSALKEDPVLASDDRLRLHVGELEANLLHDVGKSFESLKLARSLLEESERVFGPLDALSQDLLQFVGFRLAVIEPAAALDYRKLYLEREIDRRAGNRRHPAVAGPMADLAANLATLGRLDEALGLVDRAVETRRRAFGDRNSQTLRVRNIATRIWHHVAMEEEAGGDHESARTWLVRAAAEQTSILETSFEVDGPNTTRYLMYEARSALLQFDMGNYDEAAQAAGDVVEKRLARGIPRSDRRISRVAQCWADSLERAGHLHEAAGVRTRFERWES
jgi:tetratricopeptide (TPR) repeat protein